MDQTQQLLQIINNFLQSSDTNLRKQSENILVSLRTQKGNELMIAYLEIIKNIQYPLQCRNFSASQLRLCLSDYSPATYTNIWPQLKPEIQSSIQNGLFEAIYVEPDLSMKKHIADSIGEIAGSIINKNESGWPQFKVNVWKLFGDNNINSVFSGFYILQSFFGYAPDHFKDNAHDLFALFKLGLSNQNSKLKLSALRCFSSYLEVLQPKKQITFQPLVIQIYEAVFHLMNKDQDESGLQALSDMLDLEPKFFKKTFKQLVQLLTRIFRIPNIEPGVRRMTTEILVDFAQKSPAIFRKRKQSLQSLVQMVFFHMIEISDQITEEWMTPKEGYNEQMQDDEDFETTRFGMGAIDRLIYTIGQQQLLPILSAAIEKLLTHNDWRYKYNAVMALSQIGQYIDDVDKIYSVLTMIVGFLKHDNPMLRYASCHAIGQISDDMQPKFQEKYGDVIFPELVEILRSDKVPRVVSHSAACLTNFLEGMKFEQIEKHFELLVNLLLNHSINGISLVKQSALSAISSTVQISKEKYQPYLHQTLQILFGYFSANNFTGRQYKQLKGQSIETLTIIANSVGAQMFRPAAIKLIQLLISLQNSQFEQVDPQKSYILAGWQRLCLVYGRQLGVYLENILPGLFVLVQKVVKQEINQIMSIGKEEQQDKSNINANTHDTEEAQIAISMLNVFIEQLKELYNPYVQKTVNLLCNIIKQHPNDDVKEQACKCLPNLIVAVKTQNAQLAINLAKVFMSTLVQTIEKQYDSQIIITELNTLQNVLEQLGFTFLTELEVKQFSEKMLNILKNSDQKKASNKEGLDQLDEQQKEMVGEEIKQEEEVQVALSELIGVLFKTHKTMTLGLANFLIYNILPKVFTEGQTQNMLKFGIFLIDDIVEYLGYDLLPNEWSSFGTVLMKYINEKSCVLRQAACYGLGIFGQKTPSNILNGDTIQMWLNTLLEAVKIPKGSQKQKTYGHCRDNGIAAIGKIMKAHFSLFDPRPYIAIWMKFLPLRYDKQQGFVQNELLIDIMNNQADYILGDNKIQKIKQVLGIYGQITGNKKLYNVEVAKKIKDHITSMQVDQFFIDNIGAIWGGLTNKHRQNLTSFMK